MLSRTLPLVALVALAACEPTAPAGPSAADPLAGTWHVASIAGVKVDDAMATEMTFAGGTTVSGTFGCERFTGTYTYDRNVVFVSNVATQPAAYCGGKGPQHTRNGLRQLALPMTVVPGASTAILAGREGQSFALTR